MAASLMKSCSPQALSCIGPIKTVISLGNFLIWFAWCC